MVLKTAVFCNQGVDEVSSKLHTNHSMKSADQSGVENDKGVEKVGFIGDHLNDEVGKSGGDICDHFTINYAV